MNNKMMRKATVKARDIERNKERREKRMKPDLLGSVIYSPHDDGYKVTAVIMNGAIYAL